jgi:hypothetical protein
MSSAKLFAVWKHPMELYGVIWVRRNNGELYNCEGGKFSDWCRHYGALLGSCGSKAGIEKYMCRHLLVGQFAGDGSVVTEEEATEGEKALFSVYHH